MEEDVGNEPLGQQEESVEDAFGQFFNNVEAIKVKNLSKHPMSESVKAFLSLGSKFCPNELDLDRAQLETDEEERFYKKSS